jgi:cell division protein FtsZ
MDEIGQITDYVQQAAGLNADIIWGNNLDPHLGDKVCITIIATGFDTNSIPEIAANQSVEPITMPLQVEKPVTQPSANTTSNPKGNNTIKFEVIESNEPLTGSGKINIIPDDNEIERFELFSETKTKTNAPVQLDLGITPATDSQVVKVSKVERPQMSYSNESDIEALENQPAYLRKKVVLDDITELPVSNEVSRFTLVDTDGVTRISDNNAFLNAKVD